MPKVRYESINLAERTLRVIRESNRVIARYSAQGYDLTLRQLYYQMIAKDLFPEDWIDTAYNAKMGLGPDTKNTPKNYKKLGDIVSKGRRAGMIDWDAIVDRTRDLNTINWWNEPSAVLRASARQFKYDRWEEQPYYVEVWFEKDALMGIFERVCEAFRLPSFSCRGYPSDSEMWGAAQRLQKQARVHDVVVLHFGDHDPSGIDMTRDIEDRLALFGCRNSDVRRLALNMDQVRRYDPPPNPAKETDSRFAGYQELHGDDSWELDALDPDVLATLVRKEVVGLIDRAQWERDAGTELTARAELLAMSEDYNVAVKALRKAGKVDLDEVDTSDEPDLDEEFSGEDAVE